MKSCLVTGVAGFIGSHLAERLVREGYKVVGVDSLTDYYPRATKLSNISVLRENRGFEFVEGDLNTAKLDKVLSSVEYVFHLAAQPGVRPSWGTSFDRYVRDNIQATQKLLEACRKSDVRKLVFASSSSIYGEAEKLPTPEDVTPRPVSPYGATKLAGEHLCGVYAKNHGLPIVVLRYFTVYGPRQRPDMAFNRFISEIAQGKPVEVLGDGNQERDFTFVGDTVEATLLARKAKAGRVYNIGCGRSVRLNDAISVLERALGRHAKKARRETAQGDVRNTSADVSRATKELGFVPRTSLEEGLKSQVDWQLGKTAREKPRKS